MRKIIGEEKYIREHVGIVYRAYHAVRHLYGEWLDCYKSILLAEGLMQLDKSLKDFKPNPNGSSSRSYLFVCIKNRMIDYIRVHYKAEPNNIQYEDAMGTKEDRENILMNTASTLPFNIKEKVNKKILDKCTDMEYKVYSMLYEQGLTQEEVRRKLRCRRDKITKAVKVLKETVKELVEEMNLNGDKL